MLVTIAAVGRLKAGPEREIFDRYIDRATATGRNAGFTFAVREFAESRAATAPVRKEQEAAAILAAIPSTVVVALDERGRDIGSRALADRMAEWRDASTDVAFVIGGADGQGAEIGRRAALRLAFGTMTWPHQLVRIMLAEQLYRALTILSGHPYHRD